LFVNSGRQLVRDRPRGPSTARRELALDSGRDPGWRILGLGHRGDDVDDLDTLAPGGVARAGATSHGNGRRSCRRPLPRTTSAPSRPLRPASRRRAWPTRGAPMVPKPDEPVARHGVLRFDLLTGVQHIG